MLPRVDYLAAIKIKHKNRRFYYCFLEHLISMRNTGRIYKINYAVKFIVSNMQMFFAFQVLVALCFVQLYPKYAQLHK